MAAAQLGTVVRHIRSLTTDARLGECSDGTLLRAFLSRNDQSAFEALVHRHGPMVVQVCLRALGNLHDAEDALQATFLVLARQARSIRKQESLASWLHGVALRMARQVRKAASRRRKHESHAMSTPPPDPALSAACRELQVLLDEEIARLPETLRAPLIAWCLEKRSCAETAQLLGLAEDAIRMRISRGRQRLRQQLARRGVALSSALTLVAVGTPDAVATLPASLVARTAQAALSVATGQATLAEVGSLKVAALAEGVLKTMFLTKLKTPALCILLAALVMVGVALVGMQSPPANAQAANQSGEKQNAPDRDTGAAYLDLQPLANQKLQETFRGAQFQGNNLAELKADKQTLEGLKFNVGESMIYLANERLKDQLPEKVEGIKVGARIAKLHILHGTAYIADEETTIANYIVHYADKSDETIEVAYGKDVRDWWYHDGDPEPTRGKVAWRGSNAAAKTLDCSLWLFSQSWLNPHPDKVVVSIDCVSTVTTAAPFVVAMTVERTTDKK
jgi:RNA polymerase sigma factor (sigma-70 family)